MGEISTYEILIRLEQVWKFVVVGCEMIDIWRSPNPLGRDFTHYSATHKNHSGINYILSIWETLQSGGVQDWKHRCIRTHNTVYLKIHLNEKTTIWRLNVGTSNNKELVEHLKKELRHKRRGGGDTLQLSKDRCGMAV